MRTNFSNTVQLSWQGAKNNSCPNVVSMTFSRKRSTPSSLSYYYVCSTAWTIKYVQSQNLNTVRFAVYRSKMAPCTWAWQKVKVVSRPWASSSTLALIRPLKWGTVCLWTPSGSKNTSRQSWTIEKNVRFSTKSDVFFDHSTLTAGIFGTSGSSDTLCTSFERSN